MLDSWKQRLDFLDFLSVCQPTCAYLRIVFQDFDKCFVDSCEADFGPECAFFVFYLQLIKC